MRRAVIAVGVLAMIGSAPAFAAHHRHTSTSHGTTSHSHARPAAKSSKHAKPEPHKAGNAPSGTLSVPAGGVKLFCGPGKGPLLVRKMTQGSGTTVTVICR